MQDLPDVVPLLVYRDIERAHEFLVRAFGFSPGLLERDESGVVRHGEVHAGRQVIWLHRVWAEEGWSRPRGASLGLRHAGRLIATSDGQASTAA
jgi:uncharacterized glyoxalase superfamily protein PhnB